MMLSVGPMVDDASVVDVVVDEDVDVVVDVESETSVLLSTEDVVQLVLE